MDFSEIKGEKVDFSAIKRERDAEEWKLVEKEVYVNQVVSQDTC